MLKRIFVISILCLARSCQAVPEGSGLDQGATEDFSFGQAAANCSSSGGFMCGDLCTANLCRCGDATLTRDSDSQCCVEASASKSSIRRFVITEKAPTRAFSWMKAATIPLSHLRHY